MPTQSQSETPWFQALGNAHFFSPSIFVKVRSQTAAMQKCFDSFPLAGIKQVLLGWDGLQYCKASIQMLIWLQPHRIQDPYASGLAEAPLEFNKLKQENMGAPSAGGIAHWSQKHKRVLTDEHNLPPSIGVANLVPPLMHNSLTWTAKRGRPLACGAEKPIPKQKM